MLQLIEQENIETNKGDELKAIYNFFHACSFYLGCIY
jgi:hypothetical protein